MTDRPKRTIRRRSIPQDFLRLLQEYLLNRSLREKSTLVEGMNKGILMDVLAEAGVLQEGGHRILMLDEPVTHQHYTQPTKATEQKVTGIERKKRVKQSLNEDRTLALLEAKGLVEQCTTTIQVIEEDQVLAANYGGQISDKELKALYDEDESYAFYLITE